MNRTKRREEVSAELGSMTDGKEKLWKRVEDMMQVKTSFSNANSQYFRR